MAKTELKPDDNPTGSGHRKIGVGKWHAWRGTEARAIGIGPIKGRKQKALYIIRSDGREEPVAYFSSEEAATEALGLLDDLAFGHHD